jgi:hypothetical protein
MGVALLAIPSVPAGAVSPTPRTLYQLPGNAQRTKGLGNCAIYSKAAALPSGRLVAGFERALVGPTGTAVDQVIPVYKSDDDGTTWQPLAPRSGRWRTCRTTPRTDQGASWRFLDIITTGGWQGGSAGAIGQRIARANAYRQVDPVWETYLMVYDNQLVAYYSDENDFTGYNPSTGVLTVRADNGTAGDSHGQVIAHRTWNGNTSSGWSAPVVDVAGLTETVAGVSQIGGGRPGMPNVVPTSDGRWIMTYEYFGGGDNVRYKISSNPLNFFSVGGAA